LFRLRMPLGRHRTRALKCEEVRNCNQGAMEDYQHHLVSKLHLDGEVVSVESIPCDLRCLSQSSREGAVHSHQKCPKW
jgi:hypothetical protein